MAPKPSPANRVGQAAGMGERMAALPTIHNPLKMLLPKAVPKPIEESQRCALAACHNQM